MRGEWQFQFKVSEILAQAQFRLNLHFERATYWKLELDRAEADLKANGIDIREAVKMNSYSNSYQGQPVIDPERLTKVREAQAKLDEHSSLRELYLSWSNVLQQESPDRMLDLDIDDVRFFGL